MATALEQRRDAILSRLPKNGIMVEVGVLVGRLSEALLAARPDIRLIMIDNWLPADAQPDAYRQTRDEQAQLTAAKAAQHREEAFARVARFRDRAVIVPFGSIEAAGLFRTSRFDLVFLDADHSEAGVAADIDAWEARVKLGGWIGGHDFGNDDPRYDFSGVKRAVCGTYPNPAIQTDANFTWWVQV